MLSLIRTPHRRIKSPFLLFEILIALSLMGILISLLFSFMTQSLRVEKKMERARATVLERQNIQMRLQDVFTSLSIQKDSAIYTQLFPREEKLSLVVTFDNGIDPDPAFSGIVLGRIYLDNEKNLCLAIWPLDPTKNRPWRKEILASKVLDFSFQFQTENKGKGAGTQMQALWCVDWDQTQKNIPSMIRLTLKQDQSTLLFAFRLPNSHPIPTYLGISMDSDERVSLIYGKLPEQKEINA